MDFSNIRNMCCMGSTAHHVHICRVLRISEKWRHKHIWFSQQFLSGVPQHPALVHIYASNCGAFALTFALLSHFPRILPVIIWPWVERYGGVRSWDQCMQV